MASVSHVVSQVRYDLGSDLIPLEVLLREQAADAVTSQFGFSQIGRIEDDDGDLKGLKYEAGTCEGETDWITIEKATFGRDSAYIRATTSTDEASALLGRIYELALDKKRDWDELRDKARDVTYGTACRWHAPFEFIDLLSEGLKTVLTEDFMEGMAREGYKVILHPHRIAVAGLRLPAGSTRGLTEAKQFEMTIDIMSAADYEANEFRVFSYLPSDKHEAMLDRLETYDAG